MSTQAANNTRHRLRVSSRFCQSWHPVGAMLVGYAILIHLDLVHSQLGALKIGKS
jgi:hypothetical protein